MAAAHPSPMGFSYAQAAKGRASATTSQTPTTNSQTPSSKVTSGAATPATGTFSELTPGSNWADDVEASVGVKKTEALQASQDESKVSSHKDDAAENTVPEEKQTNGVSSASSPNLTASSSTTLKDDDASSVTKAPSSDSAWETKSQTSEPAWITERKERQSAPNGGRSSEKTARAEKQGKETVEAAAPPPPVMPTPLMEAAPPPVNIWVKRAEDAKAKTAAIPKPASKPVAADRGLQKESQQPSTNRPKSNSLTDAPREPVKSLETPARKSSAPQVKRATDVAQPTSRQTPKPSTENFRSDTPLEASATGSTSEQVSRSKSVQAPVFVNDGVSWPTPETAQDQDRKDYAERETAEKRSDDATPTAKRKKPEWTPIPVKYSTTGMNEKSERRLRPPTGDRGNRGGSGGRGGRGGFRGAPNGVNGADHQTSKSHSYPNQHSEATTTSKIANTNNRDAATPSKPKRASSAGPRQELKLESLPESGSEGYNAMQTTVSDSNVQEQDAVAVASTNGLNKPFPQPRRTTSPKKIEQNGQDDEVVPKPIPRGSSAGTQTEERPTESTVSDAPPIRMVPSDSRKESRHAAELRDPSWATPSRGSKRGGRGRGGNGNRELVNGHMAGTAYGNNLGQDYQAASPYGVPASPAYAASRGSNQFTYPPPGRGGWRGNPRSQSIPIDTFYNQRFGGSFTGPQQAVPALQPYMSGMYDINGYPMTALPLSPQMDSDYLMSMVTTQLEYYFSIDNLLKDMFLRKNMDSQGFVFLDVVANFNRIKQLTQDKDLLKAVCMGSQTIEIRVGEDSRERLRKRESWEQFVLPIEQREPSAQNSGPERLERPERPQLPTNNSSFRGSASVNLPQRHGQFDRRSYDSSYPIMNGYSSHPNGHNGTSEGTYVEQVNGEEARGRAVKSPIYEDLVSPTTQPPAPETDNVEKDQYPDDKIGILTVMVREGEQRMPPRMASRTFSNGSIDSRSILSEMDKPVETVSTASNGDTNVNGVNGTSSLSRYLSPPKTQSAERQTPNTGAKFFWDKEHEGLVTPVEDLPSGVIHVPYTQLREKALDQRNHASTGNCPYDLDILYQFWCHFLLRNFNNSMYTEFKHYAIEDAKERNSVKGAQILLQFYSKSLESHNTIRQRVAKDYVELIKDEPSKLEGAAFKQFRVSWRNGALNLKHRKRLADFVDEELNQKLDKSDV